MGICAFTVLPVVGAVLAIVFGSVARVKIKRYDLEGSGLARAGITMGILGLAIPLIALFLYLRRDGLREFISEFFNWEILKGAMPYLLQGLLYTIKVAAIAEVCILVLGLIIALMRISRSKVISTIAAVYIDVVRGLPLLLQILLVSFGLYYLLGLKQSGITTGIIALTVCYAAYEAEIFRAGIASIHKGQMEAARSLGMGYLKAMRFVILPQAVRRVIPPLSNEFVALLKDTALLSVIAVPELLQRAREIMGNKFNETPLVGAALLYLCVTIPLMFLVRYVEKRLAKGD